jgi:hypothetical protein
MQVAAVAEHFSHQILVALAAGQVQVQAAATVAVHQQVRQI